jgi:hypothetical protein
MIAARVNPSCRIQYTVYSIQYTVHSYQRTNVSYEHDVGQLSCSARFVGSARVVGAYVHR